MQWWAANSPSFHLETKIQLRAGCVSSNDLPNVYFQNGNLVKI